MDFPFATCFPKQRAKEGLDRLAVRVLFDLAPQFKKLLFSAFSLLEVGSQAEFVLGQLSIATMFPADLTGVFTLAVQLPMLPIALPCPYRGVPNARRRRLSDTV